MNLIGDVTGLPANALVRLALGESTVQEGWAIYQLEPQEFTMSLTTEEIARVCHEANRAYCLINGDMSQQPYDDAPDWQKVSLIKGVQNIVDKPTTTPEESHALWLETKRIDGWTYGEVKDPESKTHPCFLPYSELSEHDRRKDELFRGIVLALSVER